MITEKGFGINPKPFGPRGPGPREQTQTPALRYQPDFWSALAAKADPRGDPDRYCQSGSPPPRPQMQALAGQCRPLIASCERWERSQIGALHICDGVDKRNTQSPLTLLGANTVSDEVQAGKTAFGLQFATSTQNVCPQDLQVLSRSVECSMLDPPASQDSQRTSAFGAAGG